MTFRVQEFAFEPYEHHDVMCGTVPGSIYTYLKDMSSSGTVQGTTYLGRNSEYIERTIDIMVALMNISNTPASILFPNASIGCEPLSFAKRLFEEELLEPESCSLTAFDLSDAFTACAQERMLPVEVAHGVSLGSRWYPTWEFHFPQKEDDGVKYLRPEDTIWNAINFLPAQNILNHENSYNIITVQHLLYHLNANEAHSIACHIGQNSDSIICIDAKSYRQMEAKTKQELSTAGFSILNGVIDGSETNFDNPHASFGANESIFFCKKDLIPEVTRLCKNSPAWAPQKTYV